MIEIEGDVAILGSGFGGSLMALILKQGGLRPVLIERHTHPRFAIGESSTPIANFVLRDLAREYDLKRIAPLAKYGTWQKAYPDIVAGIKRGFSYFDEERGKPFVPRDDHANELLVAANYSTEHSDTQWLRADVDAFFVEEVRQAGIPYVDHTQIETYAESQGGWTLTGHRRESEPDELLGPRLQDHRDSAHTGSDDSERVEVTASFVIDASGDAGALRETLGLSKAPTDFITNSRSIYGHFTGVGSWHDYMAANGGRVEDHPYPCDLAALHHILDGAWTWMLRFDNGVTSVGVCLDRDRYPLDTSIPVEAEWESMLAQYPSLAEQLADAKLVAPEGGLVRTGRLQRTVSNMVGPTWALLPYTAGFVDPLHSSGIAYSLCGVERLARSLIRYWNKPELERELKTYERLVLSEGVLLDQVVGGCYKAFNHFRLMVAYAMFYFVGATVYEDRRKDARPGEFTQSFLCADEPAVRQAVDKMSHRLDQIVAADTVDERAIEDFEREMAETIAPFNTAGLCDPSVQNMYRNTAVPDGV